MEKKGGGVGGEKGGGREGRKGGKVREVKILKWGK